MSIKLEQLAIIKIGKIIGIQKYAGKVRKCETFQPTIFCNILYGKVQLVVKAQQKGIYAYKLPKAQNSVEYA